MTIEHYKFARVVQTKLLRDSVNPFCRLNRIVTQANMYDSIIDTIKKSNNERIKKLNELRQYLESTPAGIALFNDREESRHIEDVSEDLGEMDVIAEINEDVESMDEEYSEESEDEFRGESDDELDQSSESDSEEDFIEHSVK